MELISLLLIIPHLLIVAVLIFIFYKAAKTPGLQRLNRTTAIMLIAIILLFFPPVLKINLSFYSHISPCLIVYTLSRPLMLTMIICLLLFFSISFLKLWSGKNVHVLKAVWIVIIILNSIDALWQLLKFIYFDLLLMGWGSFSGQQAFYGTINILAILIALLFTPMFWVILSWMNLRKIGKENRLSLLNPKTTS